MRWIMSWGWVAAIGIASSAGAQDIGAVRVATGLNQPLFVTHAPGDTDRLFIVGRTGDIRILDLTTGSLNAAPFLSITDLTFEAGEQGLLGLAFDPDYASNGRFYVNLTGLDGPHGDTEIRRYHRSATNPDTADIDYDVLLTYQQPRANHNGGWLGFNPVATGDARHHLYIACGDGGGANDNQGNNAQNINSLLGKILRIDVSGDDYTVPATNPFVGVDGADEIFAHGLRNPFRASFDRETGELYIGDVGQAAREEINRIDVAVTDPVTGRAPIRNLGWRLREGDIATPGVGGPEPDHYVGPIYDYPHGDGPFEGGTVTGGYVYRGPVESLQGLYIFADFLDDHVWAFDPAAPEGTIVSLNDALTPDAGALTGITSFGEDAAGHLYIISYRGDVFRIVPEPGTLALLGGSLLLLRRRS